MAAFKFDIFGTVTDQEVTHPVTSESHRACSMGAIARAYGQFQLHAVGVSHNTANEDLQALYEVVQLAMRHALTVRNTNDITFVEVGTWCGESTLLMACSAMDCVQQLVDLKRRIHLRLAVVDTFSGTLTDLNQKTARHYGGDIEQILRDNLMQLEFQRHVKNLKITIEICRGDSLEIAASQQHITHPSNVDFIYIDAGHTYEECLADCRAWDQRLIPGCYMAGHDYQENFAGVVCSVDEFVAERYGGCPLVPPESTVWFAKKPLVLKVLGKS